MKILLRSLPCLLAVVSLRASPIEATFIGVNGTEAFGYYVGHYYGKLDQQSVVFDCVDFANGVHFGQQWAVNLSPIGSQADLTNTRYGEKLSALQLYREAAWLTQQYALNPTTAYGDIHATIWQLFDTYAPMPSSGYWLSQAEANYSTGNYDNFFVVTNVGPVKPTGQVQEFLTVLNPTMSVYPRMTVTPAASSAVVATPEPRFVGIAALGVVCLLVARSRRRGT